MDHPELLLFFLSIALIYSSVGLGGGSSYLAILALYELEMTQMRSTALLCNIVVVATSVYLFYRAGWLDFRLAGPLILTSVPMAFLGGLIPIEPWFFFLILGICLILAAIFMWAQSGMTESKTSKSFPSWYGPVIGGIIGLVSGMVGIGGGIFLVPVLYFIRWASAKTIAATAALFILVNSISGLAGQMSNPDFNINWTLSLALMAAVFIGGQLGVRSSITWLSPKMLKRITAVLVLLVGVRILWRLFI